MLKDWKVSLVMAVNTTSGRADNKIWNWITDALKENAKYAALGEVKRRFLSPDAMLAAALHAKLPRGPKIPSSFRNSGFCGNRYPAARLSATGVPHRAGVQALWPVGQAVYVLRPGQARLVW